jgi:hypothetical protein
VKRVGPVVVLTALLALSAACGIRPTGVLSGDRGAGGVATGPVLYFVVNGAVAPISRVTGHLGDAPATMSMLFAGPNETERAAGVTTELPPVPAYSVTSIDVNQAMITVTVPVDVHTLTRNAAEQLVCTVIGAKGMAGVVDSENTVAALDGPTGALLPARCPLLRH